MLDLLDQLAVSHIGNKLVDSDSFEREDEQGIMTNQDTPIEILKGHTSQITSEASQPIQRHLLSYLQRKISQEKGLNCDFINFKSFLKQNNVIV